MKYTDKHVPEETLDHGDDQSSDLVALLIHDDRFGPYVNATIKPQKGNLVLQLGYGRRKIAGQDWELLQILLPMHGKIRLSFSKIWDLTKEQLIPGTIIIQQLLGVQKREGVRFSVRILQTQPYLEELLIHGYRVGSEAISRITREITFSRY